MKISELTTVLANVRKALGVNAEVFLSIDPEGNGFGTIGDTSIGYTENNRGVIIYPHEEHLDYDDIERRAR